MPGDRILEEGKVRAMRAIRWGSRVEPILLAVFSFGVASATQAQAPGVTPKPPAGATDWTAVDQIMGREGKLQPGGVYKYSLPRGDLRVQVRGVSLKPALALGSWVAFEGTGDEAMAMGDLVLTDNEITPVLT